MYATLRASAEALGIISMMRDLGYKTGGEIWSDASAALGIINRTGLGKIRHIDIGLLWIQQTAAEQRLKFHKKIENAIQRTSIPSTWIKTLLKSTQTH